MRTIHHVFSVSARPDRVFGALTSGEGGLDVGSSVDGVIAGRPLRLHVVGEITATDFGAALDWSTLTDADPAAVPDRYVVQLRPGADAEAYAAAVRAREPDFLQACRLHVSLTYGHRPSSSILLS